MRGPPSTVPPGPRRASASRVGPGRHGRIPRPLAASDRRATRRRADLAGLPVRLLVVLEADVRPDVPPAVAGAGDRGAAEAQGSATASITFGSATTCSGSRAPGSTGCSTLLIEKDLHLRWECLARVDLLKPDLLRPYARGGPRAGLRRRGVGEPEDARPDEPRDPPRPGRAHRGRPPARRDPAVLVPDARVPRGDARGHRGDPETFPSSSARRSTRSRSPYPSPARGSTRA